METIETRLTAALYKMWFAATSLKALHPDSDQDEVEEAERAFAAAEVEARKAMAEKVVAHMDGPRMKVADIEAVLRNGGRIIKSGGRYLLQTFRAGQWNGSPVNTNAAKAVTRSMAYQYDTATDTIYFRETI